MKSALTIILSLLSTLLMAQIHSGCSHEFILQHMGLGENELLKEQGSVGSTTRGTDPNHEFVVPVVLHIFHWGDENKLTREQIESGMKVFNDDFQGLNADWNDVIPPFDSIKAALDIHFCLASRDPDGNRFEGVMYYEDSLAMYNQKDLYQFGWDNSKYLNIYIPKWVFEPGSDFTAFATYPSISNVRNGRDGIHYSGVRFGYGPHSILEDGQEWASVITHEAGHWLNLRHTFQGGCNINGDLVDDTPPTLGGQIRPMGCFNQDMSCGVATNGSNYMDYNHDCKRMFTQGQVDRMYDALYSSSRNNIWSESNLRETGCFDLSTSLNHSKADWVELVQNPVSESLRFKNNSESRLDYFIYSITGVPLGQGALSPEETFIDLRSFQNGMYILVLNSKGQSQHLPFLFLQ